jgi:hypothetical protein
VWLAMNTFSLNRQLDALRTERAAQERTTQELQRQVAEEQGRREQLLARLESERSRRELEDRIASASPPPIIASFLLSPGLARDAGDGRRFLIPSEATQLRLQVIFKVGDFKSYRAELQTIEGRVVWSERGLKARPKGREQMVLVTIPANRLKDEDYILTLKGITSAGELSDVSEYSFRVVR